MEKSEEEEKELIKKLTSDENLPMPQELAALDRLCELLANQSCISSFDSTQTATDSLQFQLLHYLFLRRFKWMEAKNCQESVKSDGALNPSELCGPLDQILSRLSKEKITEESLKSYKRLYNHVSYLPVVRSQLAGHIMIWLSNSTTSINSSDLFPYILEILVLFITDVWSAIRKTSCSRLGVIVQSLDDTHTELLFKQLVQICCDNESEWQPIDGAILGITVILNQYVTDSKSIPQAIGHKVLPTIFQLICHPQLSIRETTVKALTVYITSCTTHTVTSTLQQVITLLGYKPNTHQLEISTDSLVEAYKAEGLLKICSSIIKVLPLSCLLSEWLPYLTVFISYLSHEASTVRQTTSLVFKQLVCKCDSNPVLFKTIMGKLVLKWSPSRGSTTNHEDNYSRVKTWESKEGRLFVYELICEYLVKNHWLMTFGPLQPTKHGELRRLSTSALSTRFNTILYFFHFMLVGRITIFENVPVNKMNNNDIISCTGHLCIIENLLILLSEVGDLFLNKFMI